MKYPETARRLNEAMNDKHLRAVDLAAKSGVSKSSLSHYMNGTHTPSNVAAVALGDVLGVSPVWLMGFDVPKFPVDDSPAAPPVPGAIPLVKKKIPLLGKVACGKPIYMNEEHEVWIPVDVDLDAEYAVEAQGDSMTGARIHDGDYVFIRPQSMVDNGAIALVCIGDEATLKRVYYYPDKRKLVLQAENPAYEPLIYSDEELEDVHILGKVMAFLSSVV